MSRGPGRLEVFAVEDTTAQITWGALGPGVARFSWEGSHGARSIEVETDGRPGAVDLDGLEANATVAVRVELNATPLAELAVATLPTLPGPELARFATMNDLHLGTRRFGNAPERIEDVARDAAHPVRCATAALDDAMRWGAQRLVLKGDIVHASHPQTWALAGDVFTDAPLPVDMICGNHDRNHLSTIDPFVEAPRLGLSLHRDVTSIDVEGLRLVLIDSSVNTIDIGLWSPHRAATCDAVAEADGAAMLLVHHQPQTLVVPTYIPRGIPSPVAKRFLRAVRRANPDVIGASGHTHRNRHRVVAGVPWSEIGSTKDYPGVWAGYVVHESGVRQVVRRVARPDCIRWTEQTRHLAWGTWGWWSPGTLDQRCFTHRWR